MKGVKMRNRIKTWTKRPFLVMMMITNVLIPFGVYLCTNYIILSIDTSFFQAITYIQS